MDEHIPKDENSILDKSPSLQFHKRNRKYFHNIPSINSSYLAIEPKTGKQVIWNEIYCLEQNQDKENRFLSIINQLKNANHPYLLRFYEAWVYEHVNGLRIMYYITERLTIPTIREYIIHTSLEQRLNDKLSWRKMTGEILSAMLFLSDIGILIDDVTSETIHQSNNTIKLGLGAINLFSIPITKTCLFNFGKLSLEMCAYRHQDINGHYQQNDVNIMLERVIFEDQKTFIINILDEKCFTINDLVHNFQYGLNSVPISLKILSGVEVVNNIVYWKGVKISENHINTIDIYEDILKTHIDHFDSDMDIVSSGRLGGIDKLLKWDDFHLRFLALPKFLQDIRNGFYTVFCNYGEKLPQKSQVKFSTEFADPSHITDVEIEKSVSGLEYASFSAGVYTNCFYGLDISKQESDSVSLENEKFFRDLEVTEKLYSSRPDVTSMLSVINREPCDLDDNLIDWIAEDRGIGLDNLIDLHTPDSKLPGAFPEPDKPRSSWPDQFKQPICKLNTDDYVFSQ